MGIVTTTWDALVNKARQWLVMLVTCGVLSGCSPCDQEVRSTYLSPDAKWEAVEIKRDCGATTAEVFSFNVHLTTESSITAENNVLVMKHDHAVAVKWLSPTKLRLECDSCTNAEVLSRRGKVGPIEIILNLQGSTN